jgi:hypothetical protein
MNQIQNNIDKKRAIDIMEKAFINSKGMTWMLKHKNGNNLRMFLSYFFHEAAIKKGAWLTTDKNGVVLFYNMQNNKQSIQNIFRKLYVLIFIMGFKNGLKAYRYKKIIDEIRPKTGWYGWLFATDNETIGVGAAYEIRRETFRIADETNEPIYVETTTPRAMILYRASGYYEYAKIKHPYEDMTVWFLKRDPHTFK